MRGSSRLAEELPNRKNRTDRKPYSKRPGNKRKGVSAPAFKSAAPRMLRRVESSALFAEWFERKEVKNVPTIRSAKKGLRRLRFEPFKRNAKDADKDGLVQEGTPWERPATVKLPNGKESSLRWQRRGDDGEWADLDDDFNIAENDWSVSRFDRGFRLVDDEGNVFDYGKERNFGSAPEGTLGQAIATRGTIGERAGNLAAGTKKPTPNEPKKQRTPGPFSNLLSDKKEKENNLLKEALATDPAERTEAQKELVEFSELRKIKVGDRSDKQKERYRELVKKRRAKRREEGKPEELTEITEDAGKAEQLLKEFRAAAKKGGASDEDADEIANTIFTEATTTGWEKYEPLNGGPWAGFWARAAQNRGRDSTASTEERRRREELSAGINAEDGFISAVETVAGDVNAVTPGSTANDPVRDALVIEGDKIPQVLGDPEKGLGDWFETDTYKAWLDLQKSTLGVEKFDEIWSDDQKMYDRSEVVKVVRNYIKANRDKFPEIPERFTNDQLKGKTGDLILEKYLPDLQKQIDELHKQYAELVRYQVSRYWAFKKGFDIPGLEIPKQTVNQITQDTQAKKPFSKIALSEVPGDKWATIEATNDRLARFRKKLKELAGEVVNQNFPAIPGDAKHDDAIDATTRALAVHRKTLAHSTWLSVKAKAAKRAAKAVKKKLEPPRPPKVEPYDPNPKDADTDGVVQEGTIWERPRGTFIVDAAGKPFDPQKTPPKDLAGIRIVDGQGKEVYYRRTWESEWQEGGLGPTIGGKRPGISRRRVKKPEAREAGPAGAVRRDKNTDEPIPDPKTGGPKLTRQSAPKKMRAARITANQRGRRWEDLPEAQKERIAEFAKEKRVSVAEVRERLNIYLDEALKDENPDVQKKGMSWYDSVRDLAEERMKGKSVSRDAFLGVVAATSPRKRWEQDKWPLDDKRRFPNIAAAELIADAWEANEEFTVDQAFADAFRVANRGAVDLDDLVGETRRLQDFEPQVAARLLYVYGYLDRQDRGSTMLERAESALEVLQAEKAGFDPGDALQGNKTYNFYKTLVDPNHDNAVVDVWMMQAALGRRTTGEGATGNKLGYFLANHLDAPKARVGELRDGFSEHGTLYQMLANEINQIAKERGMRVSDVQALIWYMIQKRDFDVLPPRLRENADVKVNRSDFDDDA